jgi:hypothetical protein
MRWKIGVVKKIEKEKNVDFFFFFKPIFTSSLKKNKKWRQIQQ